MKRPALQNKRVIVLRMAFRVQKVFGAFEKRAPEPEANKRTLPSRGVATKSRTCACAMHAVLSLTQIGHFRIYFSLYFKASQERKSVVIYIERRAEHHNEHFSLLTLLETNHSQSKTSLTPWSIPGLVSAMLIV